MIEIRLADARGKADFGWLQSRHSFSFGNYFDPRHMGFGPLRVINEDLVAPGGGFATHGHRDMEIISYVLEGALEHRDSLGTGAVIRPGEIQRMSAGTGIRHSEYNHSAEEPVHFLQIWIIPERTGIDPGYEQKALDPQAARNQFALIAGPEGGPGAVKIHQAARLFLCHLEKGREVTFDPQSGRGIWVQLARGAVSLNGQQLQAGDGAALQDESQLVLQAESPAEILLFDLPP